MGRVPAVPHAARPCQVAVRVQQGSASAEGPHGGTAAPPTPSDWPGASSSGRPPLCGGHPVPPPRPIGVCCGFYRLTRGQVASAKDVHLERDRRVAAGVLRQDSQLPQHSAEAVTGARDDRVHGRRRRRPGCRRAGATAAVAAAKGNHVQVAGLLTTVVTVDDAVAAAVAACFGVSGTPHRARASVSHCPTRVWTV